MKSIQLLHDTVAKEQRKAADLRKLAEKERLKAQGNLENFDINMQAMNDAQKYEEKASLHDKEAANLIQQATDLERKALELNKRKNEIQQNSQAEIDRLQQEEDVLRG